MSSVSFLEKMKDFLKEKVSETIQLQVPNDDDIYSYKLAHPNVYVGWVPPVGMVPEGIETQFPCLIVGLDDAESDRESKNYSIRISAAVYSPGLHKFVDGQLTYTPDFNGYIDLLNLIDRTVNTLRNEGAVTFELAENISWGIYKQDPPYPYWYGYINLKATEKVANIYNKFLE